MAQTFLQMKRKAREVVNTTLGELSCVLRGDEVILDDIICRFHIKIATGGDLKGTDYHFANVLDTRPRVIMQTESAKQLERLDVIKGKESGREFMVDVVEPSDDTETTIYLITNEQV